MNTNCHSCDKSSPGPRTGIGLMSGLVLALLPKCPFCVMAYTGTAMLCGQGTVLEVLDTRNSVFTIAITALLSAITILAIVLNNRGSRTKYALLLALTGILMVMYSVVRGGGEVLYYAGTLIVFLGVWMNGSLLWLLRKTGWNRRATVMVERPD